MTSHTPFTPIHRWQQILCVLLAAIVFAACKKELQPATVIVKDPVRHYYPVVQGELLGVTYEIENTSDNPLFIKELQTTCGCLVPRDELPIVILPHKFGAIHIDFNTIKNTGYVSHFIYCYGNFRDTTCIVMQFDTNVVPRADYIRDYEQLWLEQGESRRTIREYVDGTPEQKGYYTSVEGQSPLTGQPKKPLRPQQQQIQQEMQQQRKYTPEGR